MGVPSLFSGHLWVSISSLQAHSIFAVLPTSPASSPAAPWLTPNTLEALNGLEVKDEGR